MNTLTEVCQWLADVAPEICEERENGAYVMKIGRSLQAYHEAVPSDLDSPAVEYALRELVRQRDLDFSIESEGHEVRAAVLHPSGDGIAYIGEHAAIALAKALREVVEAS